MSKFFTNINRTGNTILLREFDGTKHVNKKVRFRPTLYTLSPDDNNSTYTTLDGQHLSPKQFDNIYDARIYSENYDDVEGYNLYGSTNWIAQFVAEEYGTEEIKYDVDKIRVFNIDIETISLELSGFPNPHEATHPIVTITLYDSFTKTYHLYCCNDYTSKEDNVKVHVYANEKVMLKAFMQYWYQNCPNIVTGWNINGFDIPFIINRITNLFGEDAVKLLSPWNKVSSRESRDNYNNPTIKWTILGVDCLDYLELYKQYTYSAKPSYSLDNIAEFELGSKKLDYSDVGTLKDLFVQDFDRFCDYNIHDVRLVQQIDDKMQLIDLHLMLSYYCKQPYNETLSPVKSWENLIYFYLLLDNIITEVKGSPKEKEQYPGGFVKEPEVGKMNRAVVSFDLDGLYPHVIMQNNLGPETLMPVVPEIMNKMSGDYEKNIQSFLNREIDTSMLKEMNCGVSPNGEVFSNNKESFFSSIMKMLYSKRKTIKQDMLKNEQLLVNARNNNSSKEDIDKLAALVSTGDNFQKGIKVLLNSGYGAMAQSSFQFYDIRIASAITTGGQLAIKWVSNSINAFINTALKTVDVDYIVYIDTDAFYLNLQPVVDSHYPHKEDNLTVDFLDNFCDKVIQPRIEKSYNELRSYMNAREQKMRMSREVISLSSFWCGKKRYAMLVHNSEGVAYKEPKIKIMGLEIVKSSTPKYCQKALKDCVKLMLTSDEDSVVKRVAEIKKEFKTLPPEDIAYPRSLNNIEKYKGSSEIHAKGAPKQVKGALMYNILLKTHSMTDIKPMCDGDKIKFLDLKLPNHIKYEVIGFPSHLELPKVFDLHNCIDYDTMYQKTFFAPMEAMLHSVGWEAEKKATLEGLFG